MENLEILPARMKDLQDRLVLQKIEQGFEVNPLSHRIDNRRFILRRHLDKAEDGPKRALPKKLGIDGDIGMFRKAIDQFLKYGCCCYYLH